VSKCLKSIEFYWFDTPELSIGFIMFPGARAIGATPHSATGTEFCFEVFETPNLLRRARVEYFPVTRYDREALTS
jgi:hypothetical protein